VYLCYLSACSLNIDQSTHQIYTRVGYPVNLSFKEFVERFEYLVPAEMRHLMKDPDKHREVTAKVLETFLAADQKGDQFQIGNTKVYLKDNMLETLDGEGRSLLKRAARTLQKRVRMLQARAHYVESKKASLKMQNLARILGARRNVRREKASIKMQSAARARLARKAYIAEMTELARLEQLRLEAERVERARLAELARLEQLRLAKLETERLAAEKKEAERLEAERVEMERREALAAQMGAKKRLERANKMLQNTISRKREEKRERCALRIQSTMRMIPHRYALRRGLAATKIQAISRMVPRKWDRTQLKASTRMQASVRRYQERCRYLKTQEGIRQENARLEALRRNNASIKMQSAARARRARKAYIAEIASRKLQANLPVLHARRNLNIATQQLFAAVKSGDTSGAMYILKNRPFLQEVRNRKDRFKTLFHTAAEHNMPEIIGKIGGLSAATVWLKDADGNTPFHLACAKGSLDLMKEMADTCNLKDGDDVHTRASRKTISESILDDEQTTSKRAKQRASISTKIASMFKKDHAVGMKSGKLKRKRPNGPWKERWAELQNDKLVLYHTQNSPSPCYVLSLAKTIVKNSQTHERTFEIYSAELLDDKRNEQGLLLFQAPTEIEKQSWLTDVRAALPEDVLFKGYHQFANDKLFHKPRKMNELVAMENKTGETPLHMACKGLPLVEPLTYCHKQTPAILWLLSFGADYKKAIHGSITPLVVAEKKHDEFSKLAAYRDSLDRQMPFTVFTKYIEHEKKKAVRFVQGFVDAPTKKLKAASYLSLFLEKFSLADASNRSDLVSFFIYYYFLWLFTPPPLHPPPPPPPSLLF
jgi:myosin heavy subunit